MASRREFLRLAALAGAGAALGGGACSDGDKANPAATSATTGAGKTLRIALWSHFIPRYDAWFDEEYTRRWGEEHDVNVVVDHIPYADLDPGPTPRSPPDEARSLRLHHTAAPLRGRRHRPS